MTCGRLVIWYDGEYEGECERPDEHEGDHYDGLHWYNDDSECTDADHEDDAGG